MAEWILEPGHTAVEFGARHMMVSWVRGHFRDIHGELQFDVDNPTDVALKMTCNLNQMWTGEPARDAHLRGGDFFDSDNHAVITVASTACERTGSHDYLLNGDVTIRGITKQVKMPLCYLGEWKTPCWTESGHQGIVTRVGFTGETIIDRYDFDVAWNDEMQGGGLVVSREVSIRLDLEALLKTELDAVLKAAQG